MPSDQVDAEFSHMMWTNFSGLDTFNSVGELASSGVGAKVGKAVACLGSDGIACTVAGVAVGAQYAGNAFNKYVAKQPEPAPAFVPPTRCVPALTPDANWPWGQRHSSLTGLNGE